jgi:hypothetical protein
MRLRNRTSSQPSLPTPEPDNTGRRRFHLRTGLRSGHADIVSEEEGVQELHQLTRETRLSEIDPYNRLYYYLYSLVLPESGELNIEDRTTVLGRAVRYIQQRTSRLDEYAHKTDFLRLNYWNNRLMSHAQSSNLV